MKKFWISFVIAGPTVVQLDWKKLAEKPSGPGALSGWMANMASLISCGDRIVVRASFVAGEIHGVMDFSTISDAWGLEDVKICWKYCAITFVIWASSYTSVPSDISMIQILFMVRLPLVDEWKKRVFLFPRVSHNSLLRCFQYSSSSLYALRRFWLILEIVYVFVSLAAIAKSNSSFSWTIFFWLLI